MNMSARAVVVGHPREAHDNRLTTLEGKKGRVRTPVRPEGEETQNPEVGGFVCTECWVRTRFPE